MSESETRRLMDLMSEEQLGHKSVLRMLAESYINTADRYVEAAAQLRAEAETIIARDYEPETPTPEQLEISQVTTTGDAPPREWVEGASAEERAKWNEYGLYIGPKELIAAVQHHLSFWDERSVTALDSDDDDDDDDEPLEPPYKILDYARDQLIAELTAWAVAVQDMLILARGVDTFFEQYDPTDDEPENIIQ